MFIKKKTLIQSLYELAYKSLIQRNVIWLVVSTPLTNMSSSVGMILPNIWKVIKFHGSKPPTSNIYIYTPSRIGMNNDGQR